MAKNDVYAWVSDRMIQALEQGTAPWRKPWRTVDGPRNIEGRQYKGINVFLLHAAQHAEGYPTPFWLTFKQAKQLGGSVRKGERGSMVVFWKMLDVRDEDEDKPDATRQVPVLRYYNVWNIAQCKDLELPDRVRQWQPESLPEVPPIEAAEKVINGWADRPKIVEANAAWWKPTTDTIGIPNRKLFESSDEYYSTLFHELTHSTAHETRLNRKIDARFGSHEYGREELIAEMGSAFLCAETGITTTFDNSAAYLNAWIKTIREDPRAVVVAAGAAQRAADMILGRSSAGRESATLTPAA